MKKCTLPRLRLGSTSFLLHAGYVPAVRFTAERCDDVSLLLLETGPRNEWLVSPEEVAEMARILDGEGATLHVHLPVDADFETAAGARRLTEKVCAVIERTAPLLPHSFVLHVDFPALRERFLAGCRVSPSDEQRHWTTEALRTMAACLPEPDALAIENLEQFPLSFWDGWIKGSPLSRCLDVGHVWKDGGDPVFALETWFPRIRVIHLHGLEASAPSPAHDDPDPCLNPAVRDDPPALHDPAVRDSSAAPLSPPVPRKPLSVPQGSSPNRVRQVLRDHRSLCHMPPEAVDAVLHRLWDRNFRGVLTVEVFSAEDFATSHAALLRSWERYVPAGETGSRSDGVRGFGEPEASGPSLQEENGAP